MNVMKQIAEVIESVVVNKVPEASRMTTVTNDVTSSVVREKTLTIIVKTTIAVNPVTVASVQSRIARKNLRRGPVNQSGLSRK